MTTFLEVQEIFYSGGQAWRGNKELINDIAFLLDEKYLALNEVIIGSKQKYSIILDNLSSNKDAYDAAGGGKSHIALKLLAGKYLEIRGFHKVLYEHPFYGYYPDVMTEDNLIVVECGHTDNADKMLKYFQEGNIKECIQIPYPTHEDEKIRGYSFTAGDQLKEFLDFLENERLNQMKEVLKNQQ